MTSKPNYPEAVERVDSEGLRALLEKATFGRLLISQSDDYDHVAILDWPGNCRATLIEGDDDLAALIVAAVNGLEDLLNAKEAAEGEVASLRADVETFTAEEGAVRILYDDQRAKRVAAEGEVERLTAQEALDDEMHDKCMDALLSAEAKLSTLEKALEWYGDAANYVPDGKHWSTNTDLDKGDRARQALSNLPKSGGVLEVAAADNNRGAGE